MKKKDKFIPRPGNPSENSSRKEEFEGWLYQPHDACVYLSGKEERRCTERAKLQVGLWAAWGRGHSRCQGLVPSAWSGGRDAILGEWTLQAGQPLQGVRHPSPEELGKDERLSQRREARALFSWDHEVTSSMLSAKAGPCQFLAPATSATQRRDWCGMDWPIQVTSAQSILALQGPGNYQATQKFNLKPRLRDINGPNYSSLPLSPPHTSFLTRIYSYSNSSRSVLK